MNQGNGGKEIFPRAREFKLKKGDYMKKQLKKVLVFALALVFLSGVFYSQSITTGAIEGKVTDSEGIPIPGAEVKISSPNMIGGTRSIVTDANGKFRIIGLQPGTYSIGVSLPGFTPQRRERVMVSVQKTITIDFVLQIGKLEEEVTVVAVAPLIDVKDSGVVVTEISARTISKVIHSSREHYAFDMISLAPGTVGTEAYGSKARADGLYKIDGVDTSTASSGIDYLEPDTEIFEEASVMGLGAPVEYDGFTGVVVSMTTKSGANTFDGIAQFIYKDFDWYNINVDVTEPKYSLYEGVPKYRYVDAHFSLGGPILKDKLWFYGALRYARDTKEEVGEPERYTLKTPKYFFKLTFQASNSTRIWVFKEHDDFRRDHSGLGPLRPEEATSYEYSPMHLYNLSALHTFSDTTLIEMRIGTTTTNSESGGYAGGYPGKDISGHYDALTGMRSVNSSSYSHSVGNRFQTNLSLSHHASDFINGSHDFKFGVEYERLSDRSESFYNGGFTYVNNVYNFDDNQYHNYAYEYSRDRRVSGTKVGFFVQDAWKITDNLTINPGIRYNVYRGRLPKLDETPFKTSAFVPRIGITWDIFGDHSTALKAHYGKYFDKLTTGNLRYADPGANDEVMYEVLPDGTKNEVYRINYSDPATIDPDMKMPYIDQFTLGIERELWRDAAGGVTFIWKKWNDFIYRINSGATYEKVEFTFNDEKGIEHTMDAYNKTSPSSADEFYVTNPKAGIYDSVIMDPERRYIGLIFELNKRFSNKWSLDASYTFFKTTATSGARGGHMNIDPNRMINSLAGYPTHMFKVYGTFILPWDIHIYPWFLYIKDTSLRGANGTRMADRWTRTVRAPVQGSPSVMIEKRGTNVLPDTIDITLKVEKIFKIKGDIQFGIWLDIFNLINRGQEYTVISDVSNVNFGKANRFTRGRHFRVGMKFYF